MAVREQYDPQHGGITVFLDGDLDLQTAPALAKRLEELRSQGCTSVAIDLSSVRYFDSYGLAAVVEAHAKFEAVRCHLTLTRVPDHIQRILGLLRLRCSVG